ncbi:MAG: hypothetical protein HC882_01915 [Acidobacteria bacterium]|nr:hypothetical protein [Acidobacteriota bacterium]
MPAAAVQPAEPVVPQTDEELEAETQQRYEQALRAFLTQHGTSIDLERLEAGVYPEAEAERAAKDLALAPVLEIGEGYVPITAADLEHDEDCGSGPTDEDEETCGSRGEDRLRVAHTDHEPGAPPPR